MRAEKEREKRRAQQEESCAGRAEERYIQDFKLRVELPKQFNQEGLDGKGLLQTYCMLPQATLAISHSK